MKHFIVLPFLFFGLISACTNAENTIMEQKDPMRLLALGDSYTIGEAVEEPYRWPNQLRDSLVQFELEIDSIQYIARTGWTTDELNAAIDEANIEGASYDWVTFSIGVNNQYRGRDTANYRIELKGLIDRVLRFSGQRPERVWVPSIPDWGVTPFAQRQGRDPQQVAQEIDAYNQILRQEAEKAGFIYADITAHSRTYGSKAAFLASDGLHPGPEMYSYWVKALLEAWKTSQTPL